MIYQKFRYSSQIIIFIIILTLILTSCTEETTLSGNAQSQPSPNAGQNYLNAGLLVDSSWLLAHLDDPNVRIIDTRSPNDYAQSHIPGAVNIPTGDIAATVNEIPMEFEQSNVETALSEAGLTPEMTAIIYDNLGMMNAARLFWTLEYAGHQDVRLLNGGWNAWLSIHGLTSAQLPEVEATHYPVRLDENKLATADVVLSKLDDPGVVIVDARSPQEYTGEVKLAERGGHIPGAVNLTWLDLLQGGDTIYTIEENWTAELTDDDVELFKSADEIDTILSDLNITPDKEVITYCQTFWRGAHLYFALRLMGFDQVRGYDGSWVEWGNRTDLPVVTGAEPGSAE